MYFTPETDKAIRFDKVDHDSLAMLEVARGIAGVPFVITSTYRTPDESVTVGGNNNDAHTEDPCSAFDIAYMDHTTRALIIYALAKAGFQRIGVNEKNGHIHTDASKKLPSPAFWIE